MSKPSYSMGNKGAKGMSSGMKQAKPGKTPKSAPTPKMFNSKKFEGMKKKVFAMK